jgi:hypothetical protein
VLYSTQYTEENATVVVTGIGATPTMFGCTNQRLAVSELTSGVEMGIATSAKRHRRHRVPALVNGFVEQHDGDGNAERRQHQGGG